MSEAGTPSTPCQESPEGRGRGPGLGGRAGLLLALGAAGPAPPPRTPAVPAPPPLHRLQMSSQR